MSSSLSLPVACPPVLFIVFNRPDLTRKVFSRIREARPEVLFIAADGPRLKVAEDAEMCSEVRHIVSNVDWPCEVKTLFHQENCGCRVAVSSALDWFFGLVPCGIVLEDDCLPAASFFEFCAVLLARFADDDRIGMITGDNFGVECGPFSYTFSRNANVWGWATWSRAWSHYDVNMGDWPAFCNSKSRYRLFSSRKEALALSPIWQSVYEGEVDTWDFQWCFALRRVGALSVVPSKNLVSNLGFGEGATHTVYIVEDLAALPLDGISFPLSHPLVIEPNRKYDRHLLTQGNGTNLYCFRMWVLRHRYRASAALRRLVRRAWVCAARFLFDCGGRRR